MEANSRNAFSRFANLVANKAAAAKKDRRAV